MSSKYKEARTFDQKMYDVTDERARLIFKAFLEGRGHKVIHDTEDYKHDLITEKDGKIHYFELEFALTHLFSSEQDYKFKTVSFLGRKKRLHDIHEFNYVIICPTTMSALSANSNDIFQEKYLTEVTVNTPNRKGLDSFYRIPKDKVTFFKID